MAKKADKKYKRVDIKLNDSEESESKQGKNEVPLVVNMSFEELIKLSVIEVKTKKKENKSKLN